MISFLFWNINKKPLDNLISQLALEHSIDFIVLAESNIKTHKMLTALNSLNSPNFRRAKGNSKRLVLYTKFSNSFIKQIHDGPYVSIHKISLPARLIFILVAVHMPSKMFFGGEDHDYEFISLSSKIREIEIKENNNNTLIVGDFNINPFENGAVSASGLNSVMTKNIALKKIRNLRGEQYSFFYNPMWGAFGDMTDGPSGSYYYNRSGQINYYWNIFDQVLIRPNLIPFFEKDELKILDKVNTTSLLTSSGIPSTSVGSDHLPISFKFRF